MAAVRADAEACRRARTARPAPCFFRARVAGGGGGRRKPTAVPCVVGRLQRRMGEGGARLRRAEEEAGPTVDWIQRR